MAKLQSSVKQISVVIPTHNRVKLLKKCLASFEQQTLSADRFEVIVISDGSTDDTHDYLAAFLNSTNLDFHFYIKDNKGPAAARNLGIEKALAGLIVFTDDDCIADPKYLEDYLDKLPDDPLCAGIGGEIENVDRRKHKAFFSYIKTNRHPQPDRFSHFSYMVTANALYRKKCLLDVGGFDEAFPIPGGEDPDLSQRLIERGYYLKSIKGALIAHRDRISFRGVFKTLRNYGIGNKIRVERKSVPFQPKTFDVVLKEFSQIQSRYSSEKNIGWFIRMYWNLLQIALHLGYKKGYEKTITASGEPTTGSLPVVSAGDIPPAISVIIPCYNDGRYIMEAIQSVERFPDSRIYEIIVVDDGSTDEFTLNKFDQIRQMGYKVLTPGRVGKCKARNLAIIEGRGKYILTLDADNIIEWDYIRKGLYMLNSHPDIGVVYGNHHRFGEEERYVRVMGFDIRMMLVKNYIDTCAIFRKAAWESAGGFDEDLTDWEDWNLWLGIYQKKWGFHAIDEPMFHYRIKVNSEGKKANLPKNKERSQKYMCAKYDDLYRKELYETYEELKQVQNSKVILWREKLKLPFKYLKLFF
jgi:glycosyltransferase involved in cell wall biosynthesis